MELEEKVTDYCMNLETGTFPEEENTDIRWQQLVPFSAWRIEDPPRKFVWEKIGDVFIIHDLAMLDASLEARGKTGKDFLDVTEQVRPWMPPFIYNALEDHCDQPSSWMLQSWTVDRIQAILHISGHFPRPSQSGDQLIQLEQGEVEIILIPGLQDPTDSRAYATVSNEEALRELGAIFQKIRPGWLSLSGPVPEIRHIYFDTEKEPGKEAEEGGIPQACPKCSGTLLEYVYCYEWHEEWVNYWYCDHGEGTPKWTHFVKNYEVTKKLGVEDVQDKEFREEEDLKVYAFSPETFWDDNINVKELVTDFTEEGGLCSSECYESFEDEPPHEWARDDAFRDEKSLTMICRVCNSTLKIELEENDA